MKNISDLKMQADSLKLPVEPCLTGITLEKLKVLEQKEDTEDISFQISSLSPLIKKKKLNEEKEVSAIVESHPPHKKKTWKDKLDISKANTLLTKLSKTLDQASISKEKVLTPFWTQQSKEISKKLWLPTKIDCVDSVLSSSTELSKSTPMGRSWFSIKKKHPQKKNSLMTSFQSSQFSLPDSMDSEVMTSKEKSNPQLKTIKIRIFPTKEEILKLQKAMDQYRWYYNATISVFYKHYGFENILDKRKYSSYEIRDIFRQYEYVEDNIDNLNFQDFIFDEERNEPTEPYWWKNDVHNRIPRGANAKFTSSINSAISNFKNGNINKFDMKYRTKKNPTDYIHFEDAGYPAFINKIKSRYWYTTKERKRVNMTFKECIDSSKKRGCEIIHEKDTGKYFIHFPVEVDWFPSTDKRNDNQVKFGVKESNRIISLDPGIRKFLVGYDPKGETVFIGEQASLLLTGLLYDIDNSTDKEEKYIMWKKVKNLISELHWKTISFLIENYDTIILPDFRVSQMIGSRKLSKITKRLMCMFSFFSFKEKLKYKCSYYNKNLIIVDESYTSKTCGNCGCLNDVKGSEVYDCIHCDSTFDRDVNGSRNIFIKNTTLR